MSTVAGWVVIGIATTISAFGTLYSAYRASREPKVFNWVLCGSFALMLMSDVLGFVFALLPKKPGSLIGYMVIFDMALSLNILATSVKTICNLVRFEGVFHSILTTTRFPYRTWMNHALVAFTTIITLFSIMIAWVIDFYPNDHGGSQLPGLPAQYKGGVTGGGIASVWLVSVDLTVSILSLSVVRMLRKKWRTLRQRWNVRSEWTTDASGSSMKFKWSSLGKLKSYLESTSSTEHSRNSDSANYGTQFSQTSVASLKAYPELQSYKHFVLANHASMSNGSSLEEYEDEPVATTPTNTGSTSKSMFLNTNLPILIHFAQRQRTFQLQRRSEPRFSHSEYIQPSVYPPLSTASSGVSSRSSHRNSDAHNQPQKKPEPQFSHLGSVQPSLYPPSSTASPAASSKSSHPLREPEKYDPRISKLGSIQSTGHPSSLAASSSKSSYTPPQPTEINVETAYSKLATDGAQEISTSSPKRTRFNVLDFEKPLRIRKPAHTIYDDRSERGVRTMYWILTFQILIPLIVVPFFIGYSANLFISGITTIFLRIYNLIILEYIYLIRTVVHYTSMQAMIEEASTDNIGVGRSKSSTRGDHEPDVDIKEDADVGAHRETNGDSADQPDTANLLGN
ncbi:hypothetical protein BJ742DRAFT_815371 [Cladochytrium replicatum]|nr:hypothetical protein BJ742DRAFT_815371 [Cladochytrium replicatum]